MNFNYEQQTALDTVGKWLREKPSQVFRMFGYAGVGKTTLAKYLAEGVGQVLFAAYTGKAASVMQDMGCHNATTIHRLIYTPSEKSKLKLRDLNTRYADLLEETPLEERDLHPKLVTLRRLIKEEGDRIKQPAFTLNIDSPVKDVDLLIIDECSMVGEKIGKDLLSFGTPILVLGDPAQLPPIRSGGFFTNHSPDVMLEEIHRQAKDNPIIDMATRVRKQERLEPGAYGDSLVIDGKPTEEMVMSADQVLVGKNITRRKCNNKIRRLLGHGTDPCPVVGDKLVCLKNDHDMGLLNGTLWRVDGVDYIPGLDRVNLTVTTWENIIPFSVDVDAHMHYFQNREQDLGYWEIRDAQSFDFGYALTAHKAQGSQWDKVVVFDESYVFKQVWWRWLYTAITRASKQVIICR